MTVIIEDRATESSTARFTYFDVGTEVGMARLMTTLRDLDTLIFWAELITEISLVGFNGSLDRRRILRSNHYSVTRVSFNSPLIVEIATSATAVIGVITAAFKGANAIRRDLAATSSSRRRSELQIKVYESLEQRLDIANGRGMTEPTIPEDHELIRRLLESSAETLMDLRSIDSDST